MTVNLTDFLNARLDEDERYCRALQAAGERFRDGATPAQHLRATPFLSEIMDGLLDDREAVSALAAVHAVGVPNDLDRLLREVEAKRRVLADCASRMDELDQYPNGLVSPRAVLARRTVRALAAVYSDHPDYDPAWAA